MALFEWKTIKGQKAKQPYAIAMKDSTPFGLAGVWENWKEPSSGEWLRTFAIITTDANELVGDIHDRMPVILPRELYERWLGEELDRHDLMRPFPAHLMRIWPISTRVNKPARMTIPPFWNRSRERLDHQRAAKCGKLQTLASTPPTNGVCHDSESRLMRDPSCSAPYGAWHRTCFLSYEQSSADNWSEPWASVFIVKFTIYSTRISKPAAQT
jgi:SOS response associated peptidase (SRAP)